MRKMKYTNKTNVILKSGTGNLRTSSNSNISYIQRNASREIKLNLWAKFDELNFNGISALAYLSDDISRKSIGICEVTAYAIDQGNSWNEILIGTKTGAVTNNGVVVNFDSTELPPIQGDVTLKLFARATRLGKNYYQTGYFNHLGIIEPVGTNKNMINFLRLTKLDE